MPGPSLPDSWQYLIIGGGFSGLELAGELSRSGAERIAVVEAGPSADLRHVNVTLSEADAYRLWLEPAGDSSFHRPWSSSSPPHYQGASGLRRRLGGRSLYWYGITLPVEDWALTAPWWPASVVADLTGSWRDGPSLHDRVIAHLETWRGTPLDEGRAPVDLDGLELRRTPRAVRHAGQPGRWFAYTPLDRWRDPNTGQVSSELPFHVYQRTEAVTLLLEGGRTVGASVRGSGDREPAEIRSEVVVLAAGAIENARLAAQALAHLDPDRFDALGDVTDHIVQGAFVHLSAAQAAPLLDRFAAGSWYSACPDERSNLFLDLGARPGGELVVELQMTGEQLPSRGTRIRWDRVAGEPWPATVDSTRTVDERSLIDGQQRRLREVWKSLAATIGVPARELRFADYDAPRNTNALLLNPSAGARPPGRPHTWANQLGTEDHEGGTLPLGVAASDDHELLGVPGTFVAGPASLPRSGAANPVLTTIALAHRLAAILAERG